MTNREFAFMAALQRADSYGRTFDGERVFSDGRELRAIYDALLAVAHGIDAANEKLDELCDMQKYISDSLIERS